MSNPERFWSFLTTFNGLETSLEILNTNQIFHRSSIPYIFSSEKNLIWYYLIFSFKYLPENAKMSKITIFSQKMLKGHKV